MDRRTIHKRIPMPIVRAPLYIPKKNNPHKLTAFYAPPAYDSMGIWHLGRRSTTMENRTSKYRGYLPVNFYTFTYCGENVSFLNSETARKMYQETHLIEVEESDGQIIVQKESTIGTLADLILYTYIALIQKRMMSTTNCHCGKCTSDPILLSEKETGWYDNCEKILKQSNIDQAYMSVLWVNLYELKHIVLEIYRHNAPQQKEKCSPAGDDLNAEQKIEAMIQQLVTVFTKECLSQNIYRLPKPIVNTVLHR